MAVKDKEATFVQVLMTIDSQLRKRHTEGFCDNPYPHPPPTPTPPKSNSLDRKPSKRTLNIFYKDTAVASVEKETVV